ncbi:MAG: hypothetical protein ACYC25_05915, partial [Paludibacter sp.]
ILLVFLILIESCASNKVNETDKGVDVLYEMRIPNTSKVIYSYEDFGEYAFSDWESGQQIVDSTESFKINKEFSLPFYFVRYNTKTNKIDGIKLIEVDEKDDKETTDLQVNGINCSIKKYRYKTGSGTNMFYKYREFTETDDSLCFKDISIDCFGLDLGKNISFSKGIITAETDSVGYVTEIKMNIFNEFPLWEMMNKSKNSVNSNQTTKKFDGKNQTGLPPFTLVYEFNLSFKPDSLSKKQKISNYGIFKRIK